MKEKTKLRVIQILCIVSLIITVFSIQRTYAKYFEKVDTTYATNIKRWVINVNNTNIRRNQNLSTIMQPEFIEDEHMNSNNTLVPGRKGYFPFIIDYSKVDLAFRFNLDFEQLNKKTIVVGEGDDATTTEVNNFLEDFEIYGFEIRDGSNVYTTQITGLEMINPIIDPVSGLVTYSKLTEDEEVVQQQINLDTDKKVEIRALFMWNDENKDTTDTAEETGMNNYEDTQYAGNAIEGDTVHTNLNYNVQITFTQHIGTHS